MLKSAIKKINFFVFIFALILCEILTVIFLEGIVCNRRFSFFVGMTGVIIFSFLTAIIMCKLLKLFGI